MKPRRCKCGHPHDDHILLRRTAEALQVGRCSYANCDCAQYRPTVELKGYRNVSVYLPHPEQRRALKRLLKVVRNDRGDNTITPGHLVREVLLEYLRQCGYRPDPTPTIKGRKS